MVGDVPTEGVDSVDGETSDGDECDVSGDINVCDVGEVCDGTRGEVDGDTSPVEADDLDKVDPSVV